MRKLQGLITLQGQLGNAKMHVRHMIHYDPGSPSEEGSQRQPWWTRAAQKPEKNMDT